MKKILSILLCLALAAVLLPVFVLPARADESYGDWRYEIDSVGDANVTKYEGTGGDVTIPSDMDGHKTADIYSDAFADCKTITGITIPEGVKTIGENAFKNCSNLTVVRVPSTLVWIDDSAFLGCSSLKDVYYNGCEIAWWDKVEIEGSNDSLTSAALHYLAPTIEAEPEGGRNRVEWTEVKEAAQYRIYRRDKSSGSWSNWGEVARLASGATWYDKDVTAGIDYQYRMRAFVDGKGKAYSNTMTVKAIPEWEYILYAGEARIEAYNGAGGSVTIPSELDGYKVTTIGDDVFYYRSEITEVKFPSGLKEIGSGTFRFCSGMTSVTLPEGLWLVESAAFQDCSSLKSITIPASVTAIGNSAFLGCTTLKDVYYGGTEAQWAAIDFAVENEALTGATIHFNSTSVAITTQPQNVTATAGSTAKFTVKASGTGLTYQWQYSIDGGDTWKDSPATGNKTATLSVPATATRNGYKYRCVVKSGTAKVTSKAATLTVTAGAADAKVTISTQPASVTAAVGGTAKLTVKASGTGLTYQWQYSTDGGSTWKDSPATGNKTATLSVPATATRNGYKYRCVVKSGTAKVTSKAATLTVSASAKPTITTQPKSVTAAAGSTVKFTVKASGSNLTYQWQYSTDGGKTWKASPATGNKTATLSVPATASRNGYKYRCVVKSGTAKATSKAATLTVTG